MIDRLSSMTACYASTVSRTCWHALDATLAHVCERLCTYSCEMGLGGRGGVITFLASVSRRSSFFYDGMLR